MNGTDGELISRYASTRSAECFAELVSRHRDMVYTAAVRVVREPEAAEDVTQESFLRLARTAASIRGSVAAWLHRVAVNVSIDALRRERSRRRREEEAAIITHREGEATWDEIKYEVHQAIEQLPDELREPVVMHFLTGMTQSEVADEVGVTPATVCRRVKQGVERLRGHLKKAGVVVSASALGTMLATQTAEAAPAALVAALGRLALAGIPSSAPSGGAIGSAVARIAAASWKAKATCAVVAAVAGGVGVHQVVSSAPPDGSATSPPPVTKQLPALNAMKAGADAPDSTQSADPSTAAETTASESAPLPTAAALPLTTVRTAEPPSRTARRKTPSVAAPSEKAPDDTASPASSTETEIAALPDDSPAQAPDDRESAVLSAIAQLSDPDPEVRRRAADELARIAPVVRELTQLTNSPAHDRIPSWSPDGSKIAFNSERDGNFEIYVMKGDGSDQTRLTYSPASDMRPTWSPDGSKIAFSSDRDGDPGIYVMNTDGSGKTKLTTGVGRNSHPTWSADGSQIAFESDREGNWEIYVMNADGSGQTNLTKNPENEGTPSWSPDGSKIAFVRIQAGTPRPGGVAGQRPPQFHQLAGSSEIYVMNADGSAQTNLTNARTRDARPTWSPDGSRIAFIGSRDGDPEIYAMDAEDGGNLVRLTTYRGTDRRPAWSPDGAKVAFDSNRGGNDDIYLMSADIAGLTPAVRQLARALQDDDPNVRRAVAEALAWVVVHVRDEATLEQAVPALIGGLGDEQATVRRCAASALTSVATALSEHEALGPAIPLLLEALGDEDASVVLAAAQPLALIAGELQDEEALQRAIPALLTAMRDVDPTTFIAAGEAVGQIAQRDARALEPALPHLMQLLEEGNSIARRYALNAIRDVVSVLGEEAALEPFFGPLTEMLQDEDPARRREGAEALGYIAPSLQSAAGLDRAFFLLFEAMEDDDPFVRRRATDALDKMGLAVPGAAR